MSLTDQNKHKNINMCKDVYFSADVCLALEALGDLDLLEEELRELDLRFPISTFDFETLTLKMRPNILQFLSSN